MRRSATLLVVWVLLVVAGPSLAAEPPAGLRQASSRHLTLVTDLPWSDEIAELPEVFDHAVAAWGEFFSVPEEKTADWRVTAYLVGDRERFARAGLMPGDAPRFLHGYAEGNRLWVHEQQSAYYRRHLLLHEGTHAFMFTMLGGCGPPWCMEGLAELLGAHRWEDRQLALGWFPRRREEAPQLGRIHALRDEWAAGRALGVPEVLAFSQADFLREIPYAWSWALVAFLHQHPRYAPAFQNLLAAVDGPRLKRPLPELLGDDWPLLLEEWQVYLADLEHAYDFPRTAIDFARGRTEVDENPRTCRIAADRGWQNTGLRLSAGKTCQLSARGRFQLGQSPVVWWSEPGGVSIRYYHGHPVGMLLAVVRPDTNSSSDKPGEGPTEKGSTDGPSALLNPTAIGTAATLTPQHEGTLYLRLNDSAGELADNQGEVEVAVTLAPVKGD